MKKYLLVGLGNIGKEYAHTRHNIGFDVLNYFIHRHGAAFSQGRLAYVAEIKWKGKKFICICPTTYMNLSGDAVKYWLNKEKLLPEQMLVIVDDVALPLNKIRLRASGSDGGHNGLKSVEETIGTRNYPRLRFGIGNAYPKGMQSEYVLARWNKEEEGLVLKKIEACAEIIENMASKGLELTMNEVNNREYLL